ncbi:response regulator [Devosia beringensis]|uniref:hypothetical protein n=1 Tax=Devosia beringensis TaxID=2657486 RepID=UPI00186B7F98|nr:hypothetical protein [Devosia beringensis]
MRSGHTVLIVEAEFLIAFDIQRMLESRIAGTMLFARSPQEARQHEHLWPTIDLAIVEISHEPHHSGPLLAGLREAGIAIILSTLDSKMQQGHPEFPGAPVILKPMIEEDFHSAVSLALSGPPRTNGYAS